MSVKESAGNLKLIETLSPKKRQSIVSADRDEPSVINFERMASFDSASMVSGGDMKRGSVIKISNLLNN